MKNLFNACVIKSRTLNGSRTPFTFCFAVLTTLVLETESTSKKLLESVGRIKSNLNKPLLSKSFFSLGFFCNQFSNYVINLHNKKTTGKSGFIKIIKKNFTLFIAKILLLVKSIFCYVQINGQAPAL